MDHPLGGGISLLRETEPQTADELDRTRGRAYAACLTTVGAFILPDQHEVTAVARDPVTGAMYIGEEAFVSWIATIVASHADASFIKAPKRRSGLL